MRLVARRAFACGLVVAAFATAQTSSAGADPRGVAAGSPNPLLGVNGFLDRHWGALWRQYREYKREGRPQSAGLVLKLARYPSFKWFGTWDHRPGSAVRTYLQRAAAEEPGTVPLIVTMRHIHRRCHRGYDGGGRRADRSYKRWMRRLAHGIGWRRVVIGYEPDSLGTLECLSPGRRRARLRLLRYGVKVLSKLPGATIYLEAGASDWRPVRVIARRLRAIGIGRVRGFMLNVTHHDWTSKNVRYGLALSRRVGGKPFVVSTSENGNGPHRWKVWTSRSAYYWHNDWCNPPNAAAGPPPTTNTGNPKVDAFLWIGRLGYSGGHCHGGPGPGMFWPERAMQLARLAHW